MKKAKVLPFPERRARSQAKDSVADAANRALPAADRLWELLDRNISISVWEDRHQ